MPDEYQYAEQNFGNIPTKMRDLEEKYRILKDRTLLIGQNLIEMKENSDKKTLEMKRDLEILKSSVQRLTVFIETASEEFSKFARKDDLDILHKQIKMFQPFSGAKQAKTNK